MRRALSVDCCPLTVVRCPLTFIIKVMVASNLIRILVGVRKYL